MSLVPLNTVYRQQLQNRRKAQNCFITIETITVNCLCTTQRTLSQRLPLLCQKE